MDEQFKYGWFDYVLITILLTTFAGGGLNNLFGHDSGRDIAQMDQIAVRQ